MKLKKSILLNFDKFWCGVNQIPATLLTQISDEEKSSFTLAFHRLLLCSSLFAELGGYFMITLGLSSSRPIWIFFSGVIMKVGGELFSAFFQNRSGILLSLKLQEYLKSLKSHSVEIQSILADRGCTETEIKSLQMLPREVYQSELNSYQRTRILNVGAPIFCGLALFINGDLYTSLIVILLGLLSFPIGEHFFKEHVFRKEIELRIGLSAQLKSYVEKIYKEHLSLTTKVNFLSQLPLLLFMFRLMWNSSGQLLSSFFGLTQGLIGLTGSLAFQKARVSSIQTSEMATHLVNVLASPYLIATPQRWKEHCKIRNFNKLNGVEIHANGILLQNFSPNIQFEEKEYFSISTFIPCGYVCLFKAPSGKGKSTFLAALRHLIEHTGDFFILSEGTCIDIHELSREEFDKRIFFFREENIDNSARLIDLFKHITLIENKSFLEKYKHVFDPTLIDLAWKVADNLIEQEIKNITSQKKTIFPIEMLDFLKDLRLRQINQIQEFLRHAKGNISSERIFPERNFSTLSSGEKRRLVTLLAMETCRALKDINFVILDEPLAHLDEINIEHQIQIIKKMQEFHSSILIITHHHIKQIKEHLSNINELILN